MDEVAVTICKNQCEIEQGARSVLLFHKDNLLDGVDQQADVIVANILAEVIMRFTDDVAKVVKARRLFYCFWYYSA